MLIVKDKKGAADFWIVSKILQRAVVLKNSIFVKK